MNWNRALARMKAGGKVARPNWPDLAYIMLVDGLLYGKRKEKTSVSYFHAVPQQWLWATDWLEVQV